MSLATSYRPCTWYVVARSAMLLIVSGCFSPNTSHRRSSTSRGGCCSVVRDEFDSAGVVRQGYQTVGRRLRGGPGDSHGPFGKGYSHGLLARRQTASGGIV
ncbi:hypothetical protein B0T10DRAFT_138953 [Thelonectria olida]|uniref:Uncharacterized protein n=1 Tax=Thelonectria olida TaxID=1576542 RepID=A0A9P8VXJ9_9HYPO|nr:hypothetical protein B0T10DRAFT_138953 [Thelonectria olida]